MFSQETISQIATVAAEFSIEAAALLAVAEVESGGSAFAVVDGRQEPLIRFEGHYFDRRLSGEKLARARSEGLAAPKAGAIVNPATQAARWRLLDRAAAIDAKAAYESVSWGLGQVMGAHWAWLGFASVEALVQEVRSGASGQARLMARYIDKAGLAMALRTHDWPAFARGYNGPGFAKSGYDRKLAAAFARRAGSPGPGTHRPEPLELFPAPLQRGATGEAVRDLQRTLAALGYPVGVDGMFGVETEKAVRAFQEDHRLARDGIVGQATRAAMSGAMPFGAQQAGWWAGVLAWLARLLR